MRAAPPQASGPAPAPTSEAYWQRFSGVARLVSRAGLARLAAAHVCVIGVGGVGSWTVEGLARSGVGRLTLVDLDEVCVTNTNRQLPALAGAIGQAKVRVLEKRIHEINPECVVAARELFFTAASAADVLAQPFAWVVDAIDNMTNKARLIAACRDRGLPCLTVGAAGGRRDPTQIRIGDLGEAENDLLLRQVRKKLRRDFGFAPGRERGHLDFGVRCVWSGERPVFPQPDGSCGLEPAGREGRAMDCEDGLGSGVWVTGAFGLAAAGEVVRLVSAGGSSLSAPG